MSTMACRSRIALRTAAACSALFSGDTASGWFIAKDAPLADLVEKLRRHSTARLHLAPRVSSVRVTGRFHVSDVSGTLTVLKDVYDVDVDHRQYERYIE